MKKFSKVSGFKVNEEPKTEIKIDENEQLKQEMICLMDSFLKIKSFGNISKLYMNGRIDISGKEMLAEAIITLLTEKDNKDKTKLLEGLKNKVGDWEAIDSEIEKINKKRPSIKNLRRINSILEKYSTDEETLVLFVESTINKLKKVETLQEYSSLIKSSQLSLSTKKKLLNIYEMRIKQISPL